MFEPQSRDYLGAPDAFERRVLEGWDACDLLGTIAAARADCDPFVFYEGPPTANGRPGIHHVLARTLKDAVCRYQTMRGKRVERKAGWDTHGLPVELEVEKQLGISGKPEIEEYGIGPFNERCRESVFTYKSEWETLSKRIGYLLDYDDPYVTFHKDYIESVWFLLSRFAAAEDAEGRPYLYQGYKVLPWCGRCGTGLSSHEVGQGYKDIDDPSVWVAFPLCDGPDKILPEGLAGAALVAWTTTPWTLPSNMGLAVNPDFTYALVENGPARFVLLESKCDEAFGEGAWSKLADVAATDLEGLAYAPLHDRDGFDDLAAVMVREGGAAPQGSHRVLADPYVSDEDGTGVVHLAPYGADDFRLAQRDGLQPMLGVGADARLVADTLGVAAGTFFRDANKDLARALKEHGRMVKVSQYRHSYPHCWRCDTPLIYFPAPAWFLRTTAFKDRMLATNAGITWAPPEIGSGRFGEWLENNVDWALSRDRYWGTPLPVWECDADSGTAAPHREVFGSFAALGERAGGLVEDFDPHRPMVDEVTFGCAADGCGGTMRRVPQVIDCWFDSGAMPFAQHHWPFENRERVAEQFPADYICEGLDQTRGWFYSLHAIATFLTQVDEGLWASGELDGAPLPRLEAGGAYRSCLVNGLLLDKSGQKMSKRLGNIVVPADAVAEHGADAIRWSLLAGGAAHLSRRYDDGAVAETRRRVLGTLAASYDFMALYARTEGWTPDAARPARAERPALDRWILARAADAAAECAAAWEGLTPSNALRAVERFVVDELSNWYIRRSRRRFWGDEDAADQAAAFATLHEALDAAVRMTAPVVPFLSEALWKQLWGDAAESVHLQPFPDAGAAEERVLGGAVDAALSAAMDPILHAASLGRAARERVGIRVRQPLAKLVVHIAGEAKLPASPRAYEAALREELNVKEVQWVDGTPDFLEVEAKPNFPRLGKRAGKDMKALSAAIAALDRATVFALQGGATAEVEANGNVYLLEGEDVMLQTRSAEGMEAETDGFVTIGLVTELTPELECEGLARELLNRIQTQRKESGLDVGDRIAVRVSGDDALRAAVDAHGAWLADEVLAPEGLAWSASADGDTWRAWELPGGATARITLEKTASVG